jgi:glycosyltransferase involved in cell wall biosynthesis
VSRLRHLGERAADWLNPGRPGDVLYVVDRSNWSFHWDGYYLTRGLRRLGRRARMVAEPWRRRRRILHFGNRYTYLKGPWRRLHPSNRLFLTWFHGEPDDPNPAMRELFALLPEASRPLERVLVTCSISRRVLARAGLAEDKLVTIPLGVDLELFAPPAPGEREALRRELEIPPGAKLVGSFQKDGEGWAEGERPKLVKGPDVFLEALAALKRRVPEVMVLLTGPARGYVKAGLERAGVEHRHLFLEDYRQVARWYRALDLYMIASRAEGGPKALAESWASGVPVVSTRVGMCADLIEPDASGMLAEIGDAAGLARDAERVLREGGLAARLCEAGLRAAAGLGWDRIAAAYERELYAAG